MCVCKKVESFDSRRIPRDAMWIKSGRRTSKGKMNGWIFVSNDIQD